MHGRFLGKGVQAYRGFVCGGLCGEHTKSMVTSKRGAWVLHGIIGTGMMGEKAAYPVAYLA